MSAESGNPGRHLRGDRRGELASLVSFEPTLAALISDPAERRQVWYMNIAENTARLARLNVRLALGLWGVREEAAEELEQIVGELAADAVQHATNGAITVGLTLFDETLTVRLVDCRHAPAGDPAHEPGDTAADHSMGLTIIAALTSRWGRDSTPHGTAVWAELGVEPTTRGTGPDTSPAGQRVLNRDRAGAPSRSGGKHG